MAALIVGGVVTGAGLPAKEERLSQELEAKQKEPYRQVLPDYQNAPREKPDWASQVMALDRENYRQVPLWRHADSVWQVGGVPDQAQVIWEEFYVWSGFASDSGLAYMATGVINPIQGGEQYQGKYFVPEQVGRITIVGIDGETVNFTTTEGASGTFDLKLHKWSLTRSR